MNRILRAAFVVATVLTIGLAGSVSATQPPEHKVTICHATPADTAANGWVSINVDIASTGYMKSGHQDQHDADIIPAYNYRGVFVYAGKNLDTYFYGVLGSDILANGCAMPGPSASPEATQPMIVTPSLSYNASNLPKPPNTAAAQDEPSTDSYSTFNLLGLAFVAGIAFLLFLGYMPTRGKR